MFDFQYFHFLPAFAGMRQNAGLEFNNEEARYCAWPLSRPSPVPLVSTLRQTKKLLRRRLGCLTHKCVMSASRWRICGSLSSFRLICNDRNGMLVPTCRVALLSVSFLYRVKNGRSNLGARSLALVPTHRGGGGPWAPSIEPLEQCCSEEFQGHCALIWILGWWTGAELTLLLRARALSKPLLFLRNLFFSFLIYI